MKSESRSACHQTIDDVIGKALAAGGTTSNAPIDYEFAYGHSFWELDDHGLLYIDIDPRSVN